MKKEVSDIFLSLCPVTALPGSFLSQTSKLVNSSLHLSTRSHRFSNSDRPRRPASCSWGVDQIVVCKQAKIKALCFHAKCAVILSLSLSLSLSLFKSRNKRSVVADGFRGRERKKENNKNLVFTYAAYV